MLNNKEIIKLATKLANKLNLTLPDHNTISAKMDYVIPQQTVICNDKYTLWIDKYYIAHMDNKDLHYTYVTKHHIYEENRISSEIRRQRKTETTLPEVLVPIFRTAKIQMQRLNRDYAINRKMILGE